MVSVTRQINIGFMYCDKNKEREIQVRYKNWIMSIFMKNEEKFMTIVKNVIPEATMESLVESLLVNSINFIKLLVMLEETFEFQFEDEALSKKYFLHVNDILIYINNKSAL